MVEGFARGATAQGARSHQEDRHVIVRQSIMCGADWGWRLAVMDGHGGSECVDFCKPCLEEFFEADLMINNPAVLRQAIKVVINKTMAFYSGCTLSVVWISEPNAIAHVAHMGDSLVAIKGTRGLRLSTEHNIRTNEQERLAIIERGGRCDSQNMYFIHPASGNGLQPTRGLGDAEFSQWLSREPETFSVRLDDSSFVLLATDGLLDPSHRKSREEQMSSITRLVDEGANAQDLVNDALRRRTGDNVTVVLWKPPIVLTATGARPVFSFCDII